jgi:hypothetical protein
LENGLEKGSYAEGSYAEQEREKGNEESFFAVSFEFNNSSTHNS